MLCRQHAPSDLACLPRPRCRWAAVPDADWPQDAAQRRIIFADFDLEGAYGDR